jgi:hypothetical protein
MAITITPVTGLGQWEYAATVQFGADGDVSSGNIAHGLKVAPKEVYITATIFGITVANFSATTIDATNIVITKDTGAANTACTIYVVAKVPYQMAA